MLRTVSVFSLFLLLLVNCTPIPKYELPTTGKPPKIIYKNELNTSGNKMENYDAVMRKFKELCPDMKVINDDRNNCYFQLAGNGRYLYKKKDLKFTYIVSFQGENDRCSLMINRIFIKHYELEHMYLDKKRKTTKAFNPAYEQIDIKIKAVLAELVKQLR